MTFLRRYAQYVHTPKWHEIEPPRDFAERAYAAGFERGSGSVRLYHDDGYMSATISGKLHGVYFRLWSSGSGEADALATLIEKLEGLNGDTQDVGFKL